MCEKTNLCEEQSIKLVFEGKILKTNFKKQFVQKLRQDNIPVGVGNGSVFFADVSVNLE